MTPHHDHGHGHAIDHAADGGEGSSAAVREHRDHAPRTVRFAIVTVSDTRGTPEQDEGGRLAVSLLEDAGHAIAERRFVPDDVTTIREAVEALVADEGVEAIILTGGTGAGPRDVTPEAIHPMFEKELPGFGELFRMLSWEEIGPAAYLSRACCGLVLGKPVWALPGSPAGVAVAIERLVIHEAGHLVGVARRGRMHAPGHGA